MFNSDPDVADEVARILPLVALFQIFDGLGGVTGAILRAKGKQDLGAMLNLFGYYVIGLPFGFILAFKLGLGLEGMWIGLTLALVVVGLWGLYSELFYTSINISDFIPSLHDSYELGRRSKEDYDQARL